MDLTDTIGIHPDSVRVCWHTRGTADDPVRDDLRVLLFVTDDMDLTDTIGIHILDKLLHICYSAHRAHQHGPRYGPVGKWEWFLVRPSWSRLGNASERSLSRFIVGSASQAFTHRSIAGTFYPDSVRLGTIGIYFFHFCFHAMGPVKRVSSSKLVIPLNTFRMPSSCIVTMLPASASSASFVSGGFS